MNIVEELRDCRGRDYGHSWELCERAADEIENLQQDIATYRRLQSLLGD